MRERGQTSVEAVVLLPVAVLLAVAGWQAVLIGWTAVSAGQAARAAARAELVGEAAAPAARAALPGGLRTGMELQERGKRITVRVDVPRVLPGFELSLTADAQAVRE
jgi:pilus assembly protein CpaE